MALNLLTSAFQKSTMDPTSPIDKALPEPPSDIFRSADYNNDGKKHILIASSGSVATIKLPLIIDSFAEDPDVSIRIILTNAASRFLSGISSEQPHYSTLLSKRNVDALYLDSDEWNPPWTRNSPILHIELRKWADLLVIAPLSANMLAKISNGMADDLLSSVVRAWDTDGSVDGKGRRRIVMALGMNTAMFKHPVTARHLAVLETEWGVESNGWIELLRPVEKGLACGDVGVGAMREWKEIVEVVRESLNAMPIEKKSSER